MILSMCPTVWRTPDCRLTEVDDMTQCERVKRHLEKYGTITTLEAFRDYGITRLSARIWDLKHKDGLVITEERKTARNRFNEATHYNVYRLGGQHESRRAN